MPVAVKCPNPACGKVGNVSTKLLHHSGRCPVCRTKFRFDTSLASASAARETMLPQEARAATLQEASPELVAAALSAPLPTTSNKLPAKIGRFEIKKLLGSGAFGAVYHAYDAPLEREVALKVPRPEVLDRPERVERFLREARTAAQLRHPHIVPVFDAGQTEGVYFIAAGYIAGQTLAATLRGSALEPQRAARLVRDLAEAVAYAHRQGIVHRDLKPANVMLDAQDEPHLVDFGLAARRETEDADADKLTHDGAILGTPSYMAPEQARGQTGEAQPPSDQYSLGVMLYELLTGDTPFAGPPALVLYHAINTEPAPPRSVLATVPRDLETICLKAMAKRSKDRYPDCQALADDLRRWLEGEPIAAHRLTVVERAARWLRREPLLAGLVLVTAVCLLVIAVIATSSAVTLFRAKRNIAADRQAAAEKAHQAETDAAAAKQSAEEAAAQARHQQEALDVARRQADEAARANKEAEAKAVKTREALAAAEDQERRGRKQLYDAHLELARRAIQKKERDRARELLDRQPADLRDDDWRELDDLLKKTSTP